MAVALVGQAVGSGASSANQNITAAATIGNYLVLIYARSGGLSTGAVTGVTDTGGNTWGRVTRGAVAGGTNTRVEVWTCQVTASPGTITVASGTAQTNSWNISEWSGVASSLEVDSKSADNSGNSAASTQTTPTITTANANDVILAGLHYSQTTGTVTTGGFTALTNFDDAAVGSGRAAYQIVSATGSYSVSWTLGASAAAGVFTIALKAAVGGGSSAGLPTVKVEFDANPPQAGEFVLDSSSLDGSDSLAAAPRWIDVNTVDIVLSGTITRGRQNVDNPVQAGELTLVCDNFSGNFDPDNQNSVFNQAVGQDYLVRGMLCRVSAVINTVSYPLFVGRLENVELDKGYDLSATMTFVDDLAYAGATAMTSFNDSVRPEPSGTRAAWLAAMLPNLTGTPSVSDNLVRNLLPTYGGGSVLDMLNTVVVAEAGRVFIDRNGVLTVTAHADDLTAPIIAALSDNPTDPTGIAFTQLQTGSAVMQVVNGAIVDRYNRNDSNYPSMFGGDAASADRYGQAVLDYVAPLASDDDAQALAIYYGTRRARPAPTVEAALVDFNGQLINATPLVSSVLLGQQVSVHRVVPYRTGAQIIDIQATVEGVRWDFSITQGFTGTFYLAPADVTSLYGGAGVFVLDSSSLDGPDILAIY